MLREDHDHESARVERAPPPQTLPTALDTRMHTVGMDPPAHATTPSDSVPA